MSFFANEASTVKKSVPSAAPVISAPVDELKKVDSSKYAVKGGAKSTKAKESKEDILAREALTSVTRTCKLIIRYDLIEVLIFLLE